MEKRTNIRGVIRKLKRRQSVTFSFAEAKPSYVRTQCSQLGLEENKLFTVEAKKDSEFIRVKRVK